MFQTISHSQDENQPQFVEMQEEHEDLSFTDIGIQPYKFIEIHVTSHTMDGVGMHAKTLYQIETRVKSTKIEFRASRRYREFLSLYTQCKKLPSLISLSDMPEKKPFNRFDEKVILERQSQFQVILRELLRCGEIFVQSIFRDFLGIPQQFSLMNVLAFHKHLLYSISEISMSERQFEYDIPIEAWYHEEVKLWLASKKMLEFVDVFDRHPEWDGKTIWQFCTKGEGERLFVETTEASTEKISSLFHQLRQLNTLQNLLLEKKKHHQNGDFTFDTTTGLFSNARPQKSNNNEHILLDEFFDTRDLNSTSYDPANGDAYLENNYEFLPLIEKQHLTELETRRVKCCMDKLKKLESELSENSYMILSQNLVIEDRLLYLKLNPLVASHSVLYDTSCSTIQQPLRKSLKKQKNDTPFVNLKLVITELSENAIHRLQRTLAHKFGKVNQQYGFFHTALVFGPFYLEWGDSSLVTIRSKSSSKAVLAHHIHTFQGPLEIQQAMSNLAQVIAHWNGEMHYSTEKCNCQHFVLDVFKTLGISHLPPATSSLKLYLERLKNEGCCKMELSFSEPLRKLFTGNQQHHYTIQKSGNPQGMTISFKTHQELDQFYWTIHEKLPSYFQSEEGQSDLELLRAFDRAFWLRVASSEKRRDESCLPLRRKRNHSLMSSSSSNSSSSSTIMLSSTTHPLDRNGEYEILCPFHMSSLRNGSTFVEHERDHVVENELMIHHGGVDASTSRSASTMSSSTNHSWLAVFEEEDYHFGEHYVVKRPLDREELLGLGGENQDPSSEFVDIVM